MCLLSKRFRKYLLSWEHAKGVKLRLVNMIHQQVWCMEQLFFFSMKSENVWSLVVSLEGTLIMESPGLRNLNHGKLCPVCVRYFVFSEQ